MALWANELYIGCFLRLVRRGLRGAADGCTAVVIGGIFVGSSIGMVGISIGEAVAGSIDCGSVGSTLRTATGVGVDTGVVSHDGGNTLRACSGEEDGLRLYSTSVICLSVATSEVCSGRMGEPVLGFVRAFTISFAAAVIMSREETLGAGTCWGNQDSVSGVRSRWVSHMNVRKQR